MPSPIKDDEIPASDTEDGNCPERGRSHPHRAVGSKRWWLGMRVANLPLLAAPLIPLATAVANAMAPRVTVEAEVTEAGLDGDPTVYGVVTDLNPTVLDRIVIATPALATAVALALLVYALWRVIVNMAAGYDFTDKDQLWLHRSRNALAFGILFAAFGDGFARWFIESRHDVEVLSTTFFGGGFVLTLFTLALTIGPFVAAYKKGKKAHERQADVV